MENCLFCKIIKGEIPASKIYEDDDFICILDINPVSKGHFLCISKEHFETLEDASDDVLHKILLVIKQLIPKLKEELGIEGFNILQNNHKISGQEVPHLHVHIIPRYSDDDADIKLIRTSDEHAKDFDAISQKFLN